MKSCILLRVKLHFCCVFAEAWWACKRLNCEQLLPHSFAEHISLTDTLWWRFNNFLEKQRLLWRERCVWKDNVYPHISALTRTIPGPAGKHSHQSSPAPCIGSGRREFKTRQWLLFPGWSWQSKLGAHCDRVVPQKAPYCPLQRVDRIAVWQHIFTPSVTTNSRLALSHFSSSCFEDIT